MSTNIAGLCRLCLHNVGKYGTKIEIFESQQDTHNIALTTKISACLPLSLESNDNLPKYICKACYYKVDYVYNFKVNCIKSQLYLHEQLSGYKICDVQIEYCQNDDSTTYLQNNSTKTIEINDDALSQSGHIENQETPMEVEDVNIQQDLIHRPIPKNIIENEKETWNPSCQTPSQVVTFAQMSPEFVAHAKEQKNICVTSNNQCEIETFSVQEATNNTDCRVSCVNIESYKVSPSKHSNHDLQENIKNTLQCTLCSSFFNSSPELQSHLIEQHTIEINRFSDMSRFQEIQNSSIFNHNIEPSFTCEEVNNSSLQKDLTNSLTCKCGNVFSEEKDLKKHIVDKHLKYTRAVSIGNEKCDDDILKSHTITNHCSSDLKCLHCSFTSKNTLVVESHQRHCYKQNWPFPCITCKERFLLNEDLQTHKDEFHQVNCPYICSVCNNEFLNNIDLKIHLNVHSPFKKENKQFINVPLEKREQENIIFICNFCNEKFCHKSSIEYHMLVHLAERERLSVFVKQLYL